MLVRIIYVYSIALESLEPRGLCGGNAHLRFAAVAVRKGAAALAGGHPKEAPHVGLAPQREYLSWERTQKSVGGTQRALRRAWRACVVVSQGPLITQSAKSGQRASQVTEENPCKTQPRLEVKRLYFLRFEGFKGMHCN